MNQAQSYLAKRKLHEAELLIKEGLSKYPNQVYLLGLASDLYRACGDHVLSLEYAMLMADRYPHVLGGFLRSAEINHRLGNNREAIRAAEISLKIEPGNRNVLFSALQIYAAAGRYSEAVVCGERLLELYPVWEPFYRHYVESLAKAGRPDDALGVIEKGIERFPTNLAFIRCKLDLLLRLSRDNEYRWFLYSLLGQRSKDSLEFLERLQCTDALTPSNTRAKSDLMSCDICCIAADEAPYIADFVHHYLYLGFSNIFIGINNTSDSTELILSKIQAEYHNVHVFHLNSIQNSYLQSGSYRFLYDYARRYSNASYCLFVDIDEFWISDPFPGNIIDFIAARAPFDVYSFQWINIFNETLFSPPLSTDVTFLWNRHVKSICSYSSHFVNLRCHAPIIKDSSNVCVKLGNSVNANIDWRLVGLDIQQMTANVNLSSIGMPDQAWILHRFQRSELEYADKLFRTPACLNPDKNFFRQRNGFLSPSMSNVTTSYFQDILPISAVKDYHDSLASFIRKCDVEGDIKKSQSGVSEEEVLRKLANVPAEVLSRDSDMIRQIFKGTRFYDVAVDILRRPKP